MSCTEDRHGKIQVREVREQYQVTIRNKCADLENLKRLYRT
jgi:hypothetical protein